MPNTDSHSWACVGGTSGQAVSESRSSSNPLRGTSSLLCSAPLLSSPLFSSSLISWSLPSTPLLSVLHLFSSPLTLSFLLPSSFLFSSVISSPFSSLHYFILVPLLSVMSYLLSFPPHIPISSAQLFASSLCVLHLCSPLPSYLRYLPVLSCSLLSSPLSSPLPLCSSSLYWAHPSVSCHLISSMCLLK